MISEQKLRDIIETMVAWNLIDAKRALIDKKYLKEKVEDYSKAANMARNMMNMPPLA